MNVRAWGDLRVVIPILALIGLCAFADHAIAQSVACQPGEHQATAADLPLMQAAGIPNPQLGTCWNPNSQYVGQASAQAKKDLQTMVCNSGVNITNLDSNFAVCADKFMKALRQVSPQACVRDGYRSVQQQLAACIKICGQSSCPGKCAPPGQSFHQKGLAIDVDIYTSNSTAWQIAMSSTGGGIANPSGLHSSDPNHFQATNTSCSGAPVPPNDQTDSYPTTYSSPQQTQPAPITAKPSATPMQTTASNPLTQSPLSSSPVQSCSPQYYCSSNTVYYFSNSCTTQVFQQCQYGCSGNTCAPSPNQQQATSTSSLSLSNPTTNPVTPISIATSTASTIGNTLSQSVQQSLGQGQVQNPDLITTIVAGTTTQPLSGQPEVGQSTFEGQQYVNPDYQLSPFDQILQEIKAVLQSMLSVL